jgi:hypothetical protein
LSGRRKRDCGRPGAVICETERETDMIFKFKSDHGNWVIVEGNPICFSRVEVKKPPDTVDCNKILCEQILNETNISIEGFYGDIDNAEYVNAVVVGKGDYRVAIASGVPAYILNDNGKTIERLI